MFYLNLHYIISFFVFIYSYKLLSAVDPENFLCGATYSQFVKFKYKLKGNSYHPKKYYTGPIRIYYHYTDEFNKHPEQEFFKKKVMKVVDNKLKKLFHARYGLKSGNLTFQPACDGQYSFNGKVINCDDKCLFICNDEIVPLKYLRSCYAKNIKITVDREGLPYTDFIVIVGVTDIAGKCHFIHGFGYSEICYVNEFDVPIGGVLKICRNMINSQINEIVLRDLVLHQFIHMLGFSRDRILLARDENGNARCDRLTEFRFQPHDTCYKHKLYFSVRNNYKKDKLYENKITLTDGNFPAVIKKYFKCEENAGFSFFDINGIPLHFDELLYGNEIMTKLPNPMLDRISNLTLNFMAYHGWFNIQLHEADPFYYLEFSNCNFFNNGIVLFIESYNNTVKPPYCTKPFKPGKVFSCGSFVHYQYCDLINTKQSNDGRQYFRELEGVKYPYALQWSGSRSYMSGYPTLQTIYDVDIQSSFCKDVQSRSKKKNNNFIESYYGNDSLCFNHDLDNPKMDDYYGAACHKFAELNSSAFKIFFKDKDYVCPYKKTVRIPMDKSILIIECGTYNIEERNKSETYSRREITTMPQRKRSQMTQFALYFVNLVSIILLYNLKHFVLLT